MNINALRTTINDLKKEYNRKLNELYSGSTIVTVKETTGVEEVLSAPYNFHDELKATTAIADRIASLTGLLGKLNNTTEINTPIGVMTIQAAIARLQEMRPLYNKIDQILSSAKESKRRKDAGYGSAAAAYYEVITLNFDKDNLTDLKLGYQKIINGLEDAISEANAKTEFEVKILDEI